MYPILYFYLDIDEQVQMTLYFYVSFVKTSSYDNWLVYYTTEQCDISRFWRILHQTLSMIQVTNSFAFPMHMAYQIIFACHFRDND